MWRAPTPIAAEVVHDGGLSEWRSGEDPVLTSGLEGGAPARPVGVEATAVEAFRHPAAEDVGDHVANLEARVLERDRRPVRGARDRPHERVGCPAGGLGGIPPSPLS